MNTQCAFEREILHRFQLQMGTWLWMIWTPDAPSTYSLANSEGAGNRVEYIRAATSRPRAAILVTPGDGLSSAPFEGAEQLTDRDQALVPRFREVPGRTLAGFENAG